jgi:transposase-like protein
LTLFCYTFSFVCSRFILRNHIVQNTIEKAEKNEYTEARALLKLLENPYSEEPIENLLSEFFNGKCKWSIFYETNLKRFTNLIGVNWDQKTKFYENPPTIENAKIVVTWSS